jgi:formylglycine-generating enzyme required for sulfatase activity
VILLLLALEDPSLFEPFMREVVKRPVFHKNLNLIEMCLDDAAEKTPLPFMELMELDAGMDIDLWERQYAATQVLNRFDDSVIKRLLPRLREHPSEKIKSLIRELAAKAVQKVIKEEKGGYELVFIPGGTFMMGSPETEEGRYDDESPLHEVRVSDFYMGRYPVTNEEYGRFLAENKEMKEPGNWGDRNFNQPRQPVVGVSWEDAQVYAKWAGLQLPSEAQWEYACRAGTTTRFYTGDKEEDLSRAGWYSKNSGSSLHPVGEKEPNAFGLYDMHGNVREWCLDCCENKGGKIITDTYKDGLVDPVCKAGSYRVRRGGSWGYGARFCRSAYRYGNAPDNRDQNLGFRLLRVAPDNR